MSDQCDVGRRHPRRKRIVVEDDEEEEENVGGAFKKDDDGMSGGMLSRAPMESHEEEDEGKTTGCDRKDNGGTAGSKQGRALSPFGENQSPVKKVPRVASSPTMKKSPAADEVVEDGDVKMVVEEEQVGSNSCRDDNDDDDDDSDFVPDDEEEGDVKMEAEVEQTIPRARKQSDTPTPSTRQSYSDPPVKLAFGLIEKAFGILNNIKHIIRTCPHHAPDNGLLLREAGQMLEEIGLRCHSFFRPLPPKTYNRNMSVCKVVAKCALYEEDLDGSTIAGRGLRFFVQALEEELGMPPGRVVWRNVRDWDCWRKEDDSGCRDATGLEPALQEVVDAILNLCMAYGGWHITTVIATSQDGVNTQTDAAANSLFHSPTCPDGLQPLVDLCYRPVTRVFTCQHLKMLSGDTGGVYGASRSALAMACGFAHFLTQIGLPASIEDVYTAVKTHAYFQQRIVGWEAWQGSEPDENAVEEMKSTAASVNATQCTTGDCLCIHAPKTKMCLCGDHAHDCSSGRGGTETATRQGALLGALLPEAANDSMALRLAGRSKGDQVPTTAEEAAAALATAQQKRAEGGRNGGSVPKKDSSLVVNDKTSFMIELDQEKYGCTVTNADGTPRGCYVMVQGSPGRNVDYDPTCIYGYVRVAVGAPRKHGPHEDECEQADKENAGWGTKKITKYTIVSVGEGSEEDEEDT